MKALRNKALFCILSFTWGLPLTLAGCIVALVLTIAGKKSKKFGYCRYFEVGKGWGGLELGYFFIKDEDSSDHVKYHEHGHAIQNCFLGPFMPFVVCLPSAVRYWWRDFMRKVKPEKKLKDYDDVWFERQATDSGKTFVPEVEKRMLIKNQIKSKKLKKDLK